MNPGCIFKLVLRYKCSVIFLLISALSISSCSEEPQLWDKKSNELVASEYLATFPEYSEFLKLVQITGLEPLMSIRGPYTLFIPDNDAMHAYYAQKNVNGLTDLDASFLYKLVRNHILASVIKTDDIGLGALRDTNAIGDYVSTEFQNSDIILNKYSKIIKRDIILANGCAHGVDKVLDPLTKDVYALLSEDPSFTIFSEGLSLSGIKDTLKIISFPYGNKVARTRFTVLAVPDTIYNRYGIYTVNDLVKWCGANPDSVKYLSNPFYQYMEYHCLNGTHYLSDLTTQPYSIFSYNNIVSITIDTDYKINYNPQTLKYTGFIIPSSNTPAKNGAIHVINDILPVTDPEPTTFLYETTDFFDFKQGDYYQKYYSKWWDGVNTFAKIHWEGDYLQYHYQPTAGMMNHDCIRMTGYWRLSVTFPKVMKGKYNVFLGQQFLDQEANFRSYLDGVETPYLYMGNKGGEQLIAEANFLTTSEHTITIRATSWGFIFWDYVKFVPV